MQAVPDRAIVAKLEAIDPALSAVLVETPQGDRWGIFYALQIDGNPEATADLMARELQAQLLAMGRVVDLHDCQQRSWEKLRDAKLVCYVANDDGSYRPLDGRIVDKLQRMNWYRQNVGFTEWKQLLQVKADMLTEQRRRAGDDLWDSYRTDRVFQHCLSNVLWGAHDKLHHVMGGDSENHLGTAEAAGGEGGGAEAPGDGGRRDAVPAAQPDPGAGEAARTQ